LFLVLAKLQTFRRYLDDHIVPIAFQLQSFAHDDGVVLPYDDRALDGARFRLYPATMSSQHDTTPQPPAAASGHGCGSP